MAASLLILTDFFQAANRALDYATNLAVPLKARLVLLHVRRDSILDPEMFTGQLSNLSQEAMDLALNGVASHLPVPVVAEVGHGRIAFAVADAVTRHHPQLVVLGRADHSGTPNELVETTSLDILRTTPYPMLVVPHSVESTAPPRRVLLVVDGENFTLGEHAGSARQFLAALGAELVVGHVMPDRHSGELPPSVLDSVLRTGLALELPPVGTRTLVNEDVAAGILHAAQPKDFDLVVLIARQRSFMGNLFHRSVTAQVLLESKIPVLVLPAK
ncbi:Nucleotide-binding universal stress protein, UspA family [Hymenobacter arizonensis]|uniref:Nucleotide-binding universal stress protein, UspA family n=2 Tax=Hymenobacter arizonensis TaxID=1227077 RepID=A0A1I6AIL4_HYMAR|nr:Nucleotide-binding universal stress protein, UspA family [Hymenobacter arizonensis]